MQLVRSILSILALLLLPYRHVSGWNSAKHAGWTARRSADRTSTIIRRFETIDPSTANAETTSVGLTIEACSGDEPSLLKAATFMIDSFWLGTDTVELTATQKSSLISEQFQDLQEKYGERLGKRLLDSRLYVAKDSTEDVWLGMVGVEVTLLDRTTDGDKLVVLDTATAESMLKTAVASLGPKQRRQYKDASLDQIASEILVPPFSPENHCYEPICCLSNLAVSPKARRRGVALALCQQVEDFAQQNGYDLCLKVEEGNIAARKLYETKLGYQLVTTIPDASALRIDPTAGSFQEITAETLVLGKSFQ